MTPPNKCCVCGKLWLPDDRDHYCSYCRSCVTCDCRCDSLIDGGHDFSWGSEEYGDYLLAMEILPDGS